MKLNLDIIADHLPAGYRVHRYGPEDQTLRYTRPALYESGSPWTQECLYLASTHALPPSPPPQAAVICYGGRMPKQWTSSGAQVLHVENDLDLFQVMQDVFAVFDRFDAWDIRLRDALEDYEKVDLEQFLCMGASELRIDLLLNDYTLRPLFRTHTEGGRTVTLDSASSSLYISQAWMDGIKQVCRTELKIRTPYLTSMPGLSYEIYCKNFYFSDRFLGCVSTCGGNFFRKSDLALLDYFYYYLEKVFVRYLFTLKVDPKPEIALLLDVLNHRPITARRVQNQEARQYWAAFQLTGGQSSQFLPQRYMCQFLCSAMPETAYAASFNDEIYGFLRLRAEGKADDTFKILDDILTRMGYSGGVSAPFSNLAEASPYLQQAAYALTHAGPAEKYSSIHFFGNCTLQYLLDMCTTDMAWSALCPRGLLLLMEHDRSKGSEYIKTLRTYFDLECNMSRTAEALYIHRNSLIKRLKNIGKILRMNLDDSDDRLLLRICLRLTKE